MTTSDIVYPTCDLGEFRHSIARYVKLLIRARWRCEPGFLDQEHLAAWSLADIGHDRRPASDLLGQAALTLGYLNQHFLPRCGSGGVRETNEATAEGRLVFNVAFLALVEGGGPSHNGALLDAARQIRAGKSVDWNELVDWSQLDAIRADLDRLPHPSKRTRCPDWIASRNCSPP